jgi:hypothetical protein
VGPMPVFNAGPQGTVNVLWCGCMLEALSFIRTNEDSEQKTRFVAPKSLRGPSHTLTRHAVLGPRPRITLPRP